MTNETNPLHYHCGFDCYRQHRTARGRCTHIGHYDYPEPCMEDCTNDCNAKRDALTIA